MAPRAPNDHLLDELARVFMRAALDRLLAEAADQSAANDVAPETAEANHGA